MPVSPDSTSDAPESSWSPSHPVVLYGGAVVVILVFAHFIWRATAS